MNRNLPRFELSFAVRRAHVLRIVPSYTEAGMFCEANRVTITDGERTAIYVPLKIERAKA